MSSFKSSISSIPTDNLTVFSVMPAFLRATLSILWWVVLAHHRMDKAALKKAGITGNTVRLSVGIEDIEDLKEDIEEALKQANK